MADLAGSERKSCAGRSVEWAQGRDFVRGTKRSFDREKGEEKAHARANESLNVRRFASSSRSRFWPFCLSLCSCRGPWVLGVLQRQRPPENKDLLSRTDPQEVPARAREERASARRRVLDFSYA